MLRGRERKEDRIEGEEAGHRYTHVLQFGDTWHMYHGFEQKGRRGYATSNDGRRWTAQNRDLGGGENAELLPVEDDLFFMFFNPEGFQDEAGCDIRLALFRGKLDRLARTDVTTPGTGRGEGASPRWSGALGTASSGRSATALGGYTGFQESEVPAARPFPLLCLVVALSSLIGCGATGKRVYTPEEIRAELETRVSTQMRDEIVIPFEIDPEIRQLALDVTEGASSDSQKLHAIVGAIIDLAGFSISYDWLSNKTAREVFREGKGNCLSYSNLFVGMARAVGLDASYADVVFTERITREAEIIVSSSHITAAVRPAAGRAVLIDFTRTPEREYVGFELIDDLEAIANFYNNQGFLYGYFTETEDVGFDPLEKELEMYRLALEVVPTFGRARNNLGVALRRRGRVDEAIEQYLIAIEQDPGHAEALSNLGTAYLYQGRTEEALEVLRRAARNAGPNGYIHHRLGTLYLQRGQYQEAIKEFRKALSKEPELADARFHLGESYRALGNKRKAIEEYEAALEIDPNYVTARTRLERLSAGEATPR